MANRLGIEMETERTEQGKLNQRGEVGESELVEEKSRQSRERWIRQFSNKMEDAGYCLLHRILSSHFRRIISFFMKKQET